MAHLIKIHSDGSPRLVECPDKPRNENDDPLAYAASWMKYSDEYSKALDDESKHIQFMEEELVLKLVYGNPEELIDGLPVNYYQWIEGAKGKTFPLPKGWNLNIVYQSKSFKSLRDPEPIWVWWFKDYWNMLRETNYPAEFRMLAQLTEERILSTPTDKEEPPFNPHLVCGPAPKKFTNSQKIRLAEKLAEKKGKMTDAQRIDMEYVMTGKAEEETVSKDEKEAGECEVQKEASWHNVTDPEWEVIANAFKSYTIEGAVDRLKYQGYKITTDNYTARELEIAFCIGMLNQEGLDIDKLSDQLSHAKFDLVKDYIKSLRNK